MRLGTNVTSRDAFDINAWMGASTHPCIEEHDLLNKKEGRIERPPFLLILIQKVSQFGTTCRTVILFLSEWVCERPWSGPRPLTYLPMISRSGTTCQTVISLMQYVSSLGPDRGRSHIMIKIVLRPRTSVLGRDTFYIYQCVDGYKHPSTH